MIILGIILFLVGTVVIAVDSNGSFRGAVGTILVSIGTATMIIFNDVDNPSAIDVYRGKTTLKITSVNGVPIDTAVVYKKK